MWLDLHSVIAMKSSSLTQDSHHYNQVLNVRNLLLIAWQFISETCRHQPSRCSRHMIPVSFRLRVSALSLSGFIVLGNTELLRVLMQSRFRHFPLWKPIMMPHTDEIYGLKEDCKSSIANSIRHKQERGVEGGGAQTSMYAQTLIQTISLGRATHSSNTHKGITYCY